MREVEEDVSAMCFDTTSSNTGNKNRVCFIVDNSFDQDLLHLACRYHIMKLIAGAAFDATTPTNSAPQVLLFKRFQ